MFPQYIKDAIIISARQHRDARKNQKIFEDWIEKNFGEFANTDDSIRDTIIDYIEQTYDPLEAIRLMEILLSQED